VRVTLFSSEGFVLVFRFRVAVQAREGLEKDAGTYKERLAEAKKRLAENDDPKNRERLRRLVLSGYSNYIGALSACGRCTPGELIRLLEEMLQVGARVAWKPTDGRSWYWRQQVVFQCKIIGSRGAYAMASRQVQWVKSNIPDSFGQKHYILDRLETALAHMAIASSNDVAGARRHLAAAMAHREAAGRFRRPGDKQRFQNTWPIPVELPALEKPD
jgi:hypothetical protein